MPDILDGQRVTNFFGSGNLLDKSLDILDGQRGNQPFLGEGFKSERHPEGRPMLAKNEFGQVVCVCVCVCVSRSQNFDRPSSSAATEWRFMSLSFAWNLTIAAASRHTGFKLCKNSTRRPPERGWKIERHFGSPPFGLPPVIKTTNKKPNNLKQGIRSGER